MPDKPETCTRIRPAAMATRVDASLPMRQNLAQVPLFPLADAVLFPGVVLPVHVAAPRHRQLLQDVMAGSRYVVVVREADQALAPVGCLAKLVQVQEHGNGQIDVLLQGEQRVQLLQELVGERPYRSFRVQAFKGPNGPVPPTSTALAQWCNCLLQLAHAAQRNDKTLLAVLRASPDPWVMLDVAAQSLLRDAHSQQQVLQSQDLGARLRTVVQGSSDVLLRLVQSDLERRRLH